MKKIEESQRKSVESKRDSSPSTRKNRTPSKRASPSKNQYKVDPLLKHMDLEVDLTKDQRKFTDPEEYKVQRAKNMLLDRLQQQREKIKFQQFYDSKKRAKMGPRPLDGVIPLYRMKNQIHESDRENKNSILANVIDSKNLKIARKSPFFSPMQPQTQIKLKKSLLQALGQSPLSTSRNQSALQKITPSRTSPELLKDQTPKIVVQKASSHCSDQIDRRQKQGRETTPEDINHLLLSSKSVNNIEESKSMSQNQLNQLPRIEPFKEKSGLKQLEKLSDRLRHMAKNQRNYTNRWAKYQIFDKQQEEHYYRMVQEEEEKNAPQPQYDYSTHSFRSMKNVIQYYSDKFNFAGHTPIFYKMQKLGQNYQRRYEMYKSKTRRNSLNPVKQQETFLTINNFNGTNLVKKSPRGNQSSAWSPHVFTPNSNSIFDQNRKFLQQTDGDNYFFSQNDSERNLSHSEKRNKIVEKWKNKLTLQEVKEKTTGNEVKEKIKSKQVSRIEITP